MNIRNHISTVAMLLAAEGTGSGDSTGAAAVVNAATLSAITDEAKVTSIKKAMPSRKVYATIADAVTALQKAGLSTRDPVPAGSPEGTEMPDFFGLPIGVVGQDTTTGEVDSAVYEGMNAVLGYVAAKGDEAKGRESGIKAIVIYPIPTLDAFIADAKGKEWLAKVMEKEVGLVVYRNFRDNATIDEFNAGVAKTPKGIDELVAEHTRGGAGLDTDAFDATWPGLRLFLKKEQPLLSKALPAKAEVIKAIRSKSYATTEYAKLEAAGVFVKLAQTCIKAAESNLADDKKTPQPIDASAIQSWIDNRDSVNITKATKEAVDVDAAVAQFGNWAQ